MKQNWAEDVEAVLMCWSALRVIAGPPNVNRGEAHVKELAASPRKFANE